MILKHPLTFRIRRNGMSMAEILVALFLLALGTIAILTMFPLGMHRMAQAMKDDRTAQSAQQADALMRWYWRTNVVENPNAGNAGNAFYPLGYEPFYAALDYPDMQPGLSAPPTAPITPGNVPAGRLPPIPATAGVPSYPVFVDPMGWLAPWNALNPSTYQYQYWVGGQGAYPRRSTSLLLTQAPAASQRMCSLMDGFGYGEDGTPSVTSGSVDRELRYNWLWIIQRPDNSVRSTASMTVVVFDKRAFQYAPQGAESTYPSGGTPATTIVMQPLFTTIQIPTSQGVPPVQKGGWIMDATPNLRHAIFYRVVSVTDNLNNVPPTTDIEVQTPIRRLDGSTNAYAGTLMFFSGVSEVFERQNLTPYDF